MGKNAVAGFVLPKHLWLGEYFISFREREIDELVYALYGLTPEEKALVQAAAK